MRGAGCAIVLQHVLHVRPKEKRANLIGSNDGITAILCLSCREKQRKEATRLVSVNAKLTALNKLLMEENERLAKHTSQLTLDNHALRQQLPNLPLTDGKRQISAQVSLCICCNLKKVLRHGGHHQKGQHNRELEYMNNHNCISVYELEGNLDGSVFSGRDLSSTQGDICVKLDAWAGWCGLYRY